MRVFYSFYSFAGPSLARRAMTKDSVHESSCEPLASRMRCTKSPIA